MSEKRKCVGDQGVALVTVMHAVPSVDRRRCVTKRDLAKYGCQQACTMRWFLTTTDAEIASASSWRKLTIRDSVSESRHQQSQKLKYRVQKPEEMDVSEPTVSVDIPPAPPAPKYQEGGFSGSGSRANEMNTDQRDSKREKFA